VPDRLQGQLILNTRPVHQQAELTSLLEQEGAQVLSFPVIDIVPLESSLAQQRLTQEISSYDILLFVSRNAVDGAFRYIDKSRLKPGLCFGVIGAATRLALAQRVTNLDSCLLAGAPYNSETLLEADALQQVAGKRVLIVRGQQGRSLLGDELASRGAEVDYCEVYRRELPARDVADFNRVVDNEFPTLAILTSNVGMQNLIELVDQVAAGRLRRTPWLLISERMRESAVNLGHNAPIIIAHSASDKGIHQAICAWADQL
jgi:uroporphyrinogen-III synthase